MTQGAVSYQIRMLEELLGVPLFLRQPRGLVLTPHGDRLAVAITSIFDSLQTVLDHVASDSGNSTLTVAVYGPFATKWLVPRIQDFLSRYPEVDLSIVEDDNADLWNGGQDVAIRYGDGWSGVDAALLCHDIVFPVCSPILLREHELRNVKDLAKFPLICEEGRNAFRDGSDWEGWHRRATGAFPGEGSFKYRVRCKQASLALQAAIGGYGIALTRGLLAADDLESGRLVRPLDLHFPSDFGYYLVRPRNRSVHPKADVFQAWLLDSIERPAVRVTRIPVPAISNLQPWQ